MLKTGGWPSAGRIALLAALALVIATPAPAAMRLEQMSIKQGESCWFRGGTLKAALGPWKLKLGPGGGEVRRGPFKLEVTGIESARLEIKWKW